MISLMFRIFASLAWIIFGNFTLMFVYYAGVFDAAEIEVSASQSITW